MLYQSGLGGTFWGVVFANLVPTVPFVILVMIPFIEQIDPKIEAAARVFGAGTFKLFIHVLLPLLTPGILAALLPRFVEPVTAALDRLYRQGARQAVAAWTPSLL